LLSDTDTPGSERSDDPDQRHRVSVQEK